MKRICFFLSVMMFSGGCSVPSNPEKGPVVLLCDGQNYLRAGDGTVERQRVTRFYKVDGVEKTLEAWDGEKQTWMGSPARITINPSQVSLQDEPMILGGIISTKSIVFDRIAGRIHDEFSLSNGGITTFDGACNAVKSPTSETKF